MRIITFGKINMKFLIPIIGGIIRLIYRFLVNINSKYEIILKNPFILSIYTSMGMVFAFIPYIILKYRSKKINSNIHENKSKLNIELVHYNIFKKTRLKKYKLILASSICDFSETLIIYTFCMKCIYNLWMFDILFMSVFSYFLLKTKLYKHQYLSMIIIIVLGLVLNVLEYFKSENNYEFNVLEILMKFLGEIFLSLCIVITKYNMEKNYCNPYEICIWDGLFGVILHIICLLIINKLELTIADVNYPDNFWELINNYDINDFLICLLVIIVGASYNICLLLTCNYFTPCHIIISYIIHEYYYYIHINDNNFELNILGFFILVLILFMFLIFIEIIEINIFNISYNTKKNIELRSRIDSLIDFNSLLNINEEIEPEEMEIINSDSKINEDFIRK